MARVQPVGRPSLLTPEVHERIVSTISAGNYAETAAAVAGISKTTFYNWMDRGRTERDRLAADLEPDENESRYLEFLNAVETARGQAEARMVTVIQKAALDGQWQAAGWYLERTNPQKFARYTRTEITGKDGAPVQVEQVSAEDLEAKVAALLAARTAGEADEGED